MFLPEYEDLYFGEKRGGFGYGCNIFLYGIEQRYYTTLIGAREKDCKLCDKDVTRRTMDILSQQSVNVTFVNRSERIRYEWADSTAGIHIPDNHCDD